MQSILLANIAKLKTFIINSFDTTTSFCRTQDIYETLKDREWKVTPKKYFQEQTKTLYSSSSAFWSMH